MAGSNISKADLNNLEKRFKGKNIDETLVSGLLFQSNKLSGSRQHLSHLHLKTRLMPDNPDSPYIYTAYEKAFGNKSDGTKRAESDYQIIAKIHRHTELPNMKYMLILRDLNTGVYTVEEVSHFESLTEMYGYMRPKTKTDDLDAGNIIRKGDFLYRSTSVDEFGNYRFGLNAKVAFVNTPQCVADAVFISDEFAKRATFHTIEETELVLNFNDVLLNLHGDSKVYKSLPAIGEKLTEKGILCARRKINFDLALSNLTDNALMNTLESDEIFKGKGRIVDIDIHVNKPEELLKSNDPFRQQIRYLYEDSLRYHKAIYDELDKILQNPKNKFTFHLKHYYDISRNYINNIYLDNNNNIIYANNTGTFEHIHMVIKIAQQRQLQPTDKISNRAGAKGVISVILPKDQMYRDEYGNVVDVCFAGKGIIGRLNISQTYEQELNYISGHIVNRMKEIENTEERFQYILDFIKKITIEQYETLKLYWKKLKVKEKEEFIQRIIDNGYLYIYQPPFHGNISLEGLANLYDEYNIKPGYARFKMVFPKGTYNEERFISEKEYNKMKQYSEYFMKEDGLLDKSMVTAETFKDSINKNNILESKDGNRYIKTDKIITKEDYQNHKKSNLIQKLHSGLTVLKDTFNEMNHKEFISTKVKSVITPNGDLIRDCRTIEPLIIAPVYVLVLKQISDTGFSARSLDVINHLSMPIKKNRVDTGIAHSNGPISFSFMNITNCSLRLTPEEVYRFKSIHGANPMMGELMAETLLLKDPFELHDLDVFQTKKVEYMDTAARMFHAYMLGLYIGFLEGKNPDPFEKYDFVEFKNLDKIYKRYKTINVTREQLIKDGFK